MAHISYNVIDKMIEDESFGSNLAESEESEAVSHHASLLTEREADDKIKQCGNGHDSVSKGHLKICSNPDCGSKENLCVAPYFVCAYFGLLVERSKVRRVCQSCYKDAENHQNILVKMLHDHKSIILGPKKPKNQMVTIDDEECYEESGESPEEVEIEGDIEDLVKCLMEKYRFEEQVDATLKHLGIFTP